MCVSNSVLSHLSTSTPHVPAAQTSKRFQSGKCLSHRNKKNLNFPQCMGKISSLLNLWVTSFIDSSLHTVKMILMCSFGIMMQSHSWLLMIPTLNYWTIKCFTMMGFPKSRLNPTRNFSPKCLGLFFFLTQRGFIKFSWPLQPDSFTEPHTHFKWLMVDYTHSIIYLDQNLTSVSLMFRYCCTAIACN